MADIIRPEHWFAQTRTENAPLKHSGGGGGLPPEGMEPRIAALEEGMKEMKSALADLKKDQHAAALAMEGLRGDMKAGFATINGTLEAIRLSLDAKANKTDLTPIEIKLGTIDGRVASIPTTWQTVAIIVGMLVGIGTLSLGISSLRQPATPPPPERTAAGAANPRPGPSDVAPTTKQPPSP